MVMAVFASCKKSGRLPSDAERENASDVARDAAVADETGKEIPDMFIDVARDAAAVDETGKEIPDMFICIDGPLRIRSGPGLEYGAVGKLETGERGTITETSGHQDEIDGQTDYWYRIVFNDIEGYVFGGYGVVIPGGIPVAWIELKYDSTITPQDIPRMGITSLRTIEQLLAVLPDEQVKKIGVINLDGENINSFKGIERFTNLTSFSIKRSIIKNLNDLRLQKETWFFLEDSEIESLKGLDNFDNIKNLGSLTLDGTHIKDKDSLKLIGKLNSLRSIGLGRFPDYKKVLDILPESIARIRINDNRINSIKEIEFLKEKYPHLRVVDVWGNFSYEEYENVRAEWQPVELNWVEN
jgi:hypothetical protein